GGGGAGGGAGGGGAGPSPNGRVAAVAASEPARPDDASRALGWLDLAGNLPLATGVVFLASFATMGVELAASRILAPYLGLSLYSWTGIIGVGLLAITIGNYLGGVIADPWPRQAPL